jgi:hypothetical protein
MQFFRQVCCRLLMTNIRLGHRFLLLVLSSFPLAPIYRGGTGIQCLWFVVKSAFRNSKSEIVYPLFLHYIAQVWDFVKYGNWTYVVQAFFKGLFLGDLRIIVSS